MKLRKIILWGGAVALVLLLSFTAVVSIAAWGILRSEPFEFSPVRGTPQMILGIQERLCDEMVAAFAQMGAEATSRQFELSAGEMNAILDTMLATANSWGVANNPQGRPMELDLLFNDGVLRLRLTKRLPFWTPFGSCANITVFFSPQISSGIFSLGLKTVSIGSISVPGLILRQQDATQSQAIMASPQMSQLLSVVNGLKLEKSKVVITYRPDMLAEATSANMLSVYGNSMLKAKQRAE